MQTEITHDTSMILQDEAPGPPIDDPIFTPAHELAAAIRAGRVSALEVVDAHLDQIERCNSDLNAIVTLDAGEARARAREADAALARDEVWGPLHGVPVTIKDAFEIEGMRTTGSYKPLSDYVPERDATVVARLRDAGAIILGKTNMSLLAADFQTDSPIFGRANNPWDPERTPGGSSGGSGAAVAAGLSPLDVASDLGGSVRIPAHYCGVFGLKPTEHRVPATGHIPDWCIPGSSGDVIPIRHMGTYGPLARSVADLELCLSLIEGPDGHDASVPPVPQEEASERPLSDYRFAWCRALGGVPGSAETERALADLATKLEQIGCQVDERVPTGFDFEAAWETWGEIVAAELAGGTPLQVRFLFWLLFMTSGRPPTDRGITRGIRGSRRQYQAALSRRYELINGMEAFLSEWDAWLCPVSPTPAFTHRRTGAAIGVDDQKLPYTMGAAAFTTLFNLTGHPAVVVPLGCSEAGLPIGVQVVGRKWHDRQLLAIAKALSEVTEGYQRPSGV